MKELKRVDFHIHYNPINEKTAYDAIEIAAQRNVIAVSILARSQISENFDMFIRYGKEKGVDVIPGIEFLAKKGSESVDLILLGFDPKNREIKEYFGKDYYSKDKKDQNCKLAFHQRTFLESKGFSFKDMNFDQKILFDKLLSGEFSEKAFNFCWIVSTLSQNFSLIEDLKKENWQKWREIVDKYGRLPNYIEDPKKLDAKLLYLTYFDVNKEGYVEVRTDLHTILDVIHRAGGVVLYSPEGKFNKKLWAEIIEDGIDGIMGWHSGYLGANGKNIPDIPRKEIINTRKKGLLVLGGSDYQQLDWELGIGNGDLYISPLRYKEFLSYIRNKNNGNIPWEKK